MHGKVAHVGGRVAAVDGTHDVHADCQALPRLVCLGPPLLAGHGVPGRVPDLVKALNDVLPPVLQRHLICSVEVCRLDEQPVEALFPKRPGLRELQQGTAHVRPQVAEVWVHGVGSATEIDVVREVDHRLVLRLSCHLELVLHVALEGVPLVVLLLYFSSLLLICAFFMERGPRELAQHLAILAHQPEAVWWPGRERQRFPNGEVRDGAPLCPGFLNHLQDLLVDLPPHRAKGRQGLVHPSHACTPVGHLSVRLPQEVPLVAVPAGPHHQAAEGEVAAGVVRHPRKGRYHHWEVAGHCDVADRGALQQGVEDLGVGADNAVPADVMLRTVVHRVAPLHRVPEGRFLPHWSAGAGRVLGDFHHGRLQQAGNQRRPQLGHAGRGPGQLLSHGVGAAGDAHLPRPHLPRLN
mmetsp:Transcript_38411/g.108558  ORF Transcript_38411/g.108558 Transcript_38411/m.108558 type:complete len:408 (-) Transcript_38411:1489-2712(-)